MFDKTRFGPAIPICVGALLGGTFGVPLLREENPIGFLFVFPGSLLGGLFYRIYSRNWPTDPTAFKRRYLSAFSILVLIPIIAATITEMRGPKGVTITLLGLLLGASLAAGILASGDRRPFLDSSPEEDSSPDKPEE
jgi:hypothetical protein